jgi:hypothetical protein
LEDIVGELKKIKSLQGALMTRANLGLFTICGLIFAATSVLAQESGFKIKPLYTSVHAEVMDAIKKAENAIRACDGDAFDDALDWLEDIADDAPSEAIADKIENTIDDLEDDWNDSLPCGKKLRLAPYDLGFYGNAGKLDLIKSPGFLGKENGGNITTLSFINPKSTGNYYGIGTELRMNLNNAPNWPNWPNMPNTSRRGGSLLDLYFGFNRSWSNMNDEFSNVGTGGDILLIPGVGNGPNGAGFSLAFGGGANTISNAYYNSDYDFYRSYVGIGKTMNRNNVKVRPFGGLEHTYLKSNQMFSGSIPGFARDFVYDTKVDTHTVGPFLGVEGAYRPSWLNAGPAPVELSAKATYKIGYNFSDGRDSLAFTGFDTQSIDLDEKGISHDFRLETGLTFNPDGPLRLSIGGGYQRAGNLPVVMRDGVGPSNLSHEEANVWTAGLGIRYSF